jgi:hypothetical protein
LEGDSTHRTVTDTEKTTWNNKADTEDIPDLTNYVKNTDYATDSVGGVFKQGNAIVVNPQTGIIYVQGKSYEQYLNSGNSNAISKGTLENVITGKGLTTKSYVDGLVGDIESILEELDIGGGI